MTNSINELKSYTEYNVNTPTSVFTIGFQYEHNVNHVNVYVDGVEATAAGYTVQHDSHGTVQLTPAVPSGVVRLVRETDIDTSAHTFSAGAKFTAGNMDENFQQIRHSQQEVRDGFSKLSDDTYAIIDTLQDVVQAAQDAQDAADAAEQAAELANDAAAQVSDKVPKSVTVPTYTTTEAGVDPVTGVADGAYFNVRSSSDESYIDEYQNVGGVPTPSGKSYPSNMTKWDASFVVDGDETQKQINDNQKAINARTVTPYDFGAVGDGASHKLSERYSDLAQAQRIYPHATTLDDEIDWCALQAFFDFCAANTAHSANWGMRGFINKQLSVGGSLVHPATTVYSGELSLTTTSEMRSFLKFSGKECRYGKLRLIGHQSNPSDMRSRTVLFGVIIGDEVQGGPIKADNNHFEAIVAEKLLSFGVLFGVNAHFTTFGEVRCANNGSRGIVGTSNTNHNANWSNRVESGSANTQRTTITVDSLPPDGFHVKERVYAFINNVPYQIMAVDRVASTLSLYPAIDWDITSGQLAYCYGGGFYGTSNNSAQSTVNNLQTIVCGKGYDTNALYGTTLINLTAESCGIGALIGDSYQAHLGSRILGGYFENNVIDIHYGWSFTTVSRRALYVADAVALDANKISSAYPYRTSNNSLKQDWRRIRGTEVSIGFKKYSYSSTHTTHDITDSIRYYAMQGNTQNINLTCNEKLFDLFEKAQMTYLFTGTGVNNNPTGNIVFTAPAGVTINGSSSVTIDGAEYDSPILVNIQRLTATTMQLSILIAAKSVKKGTTAQRPANPILGTRYYDTTLLAAGKPIEWNGSNWVDATGEVV